MIDEDELVKIEERANSARVGPWKAYIEGRDHESGSSFIEASDGEQMEIIGATNADYDFIANARTDVIELIKEIRRLNSII